MHDRKLVRLTNFDYSSSRYYFITLCVKDHNHSLGSITDKVMHLSDNGIVALEQWKWLGHQYPYIDLVSFVIMPNHIHGIIHIDSNFYNNNAGNGGNNNVGNGGNNNVGNGGNNNVGNGRDRSLQSIKPKPKIKPLPELIGAYKTTVSKRIHMSGDTMFKWQKSYYEHIIRNNLSLDRIINYIETNPENWMS